MRCKIGYNNETKALLASNKTEQTVDFFPRREAVVKLKALGYIVNRQTTIKVRMVKVILSTGETEILLTNLFD